MNYISYLTRGMEYTGTAGLVLSVITSVPFLYYKYYQEQGYMVSISQENEYIQQSKLIQNSLVPPENLWRFREDCERFYREFPFCQESKKPLWKIREFVIVSVYEQSLKNGRIKSIYDRQ
jgi:hypothetical protein